MAKMLSASGGLSPPDQGLCPWTPLGALPPYPRYKLVLRTRHGAPRQSLTPSAAYDHRALSPHLFLQVYAYDGVQEYVYYVFFRFPKKREVSRFLK